MLQFMITSEIPDVGRVGVGRLAEALREIERCLRRPDVEPSDGTESETTSPVVEVYGATGALGPAVAAHMANLNGADTGQPRVGTGTAP
ncbi:MAG: hypothetical protein H7X95_12555, partial [Deltaproteobacteria bacterium]|nr:hypothetical protein [Deltaproteobacteria bacterium]